MSFTIPNVVDAGFPDQAGIDSGDIAIMTAGDSLTGVVSGCATTGSNAANGSLIIAAGVVLVAGLQATCAGATVVVTANSSGNPRYDLVVVNDAGTVSITAGTAAASPSFPAIPANSVVVATYRVPNGHTTSTTIPTNSTNLTDKRLMIPASPARTGAPTAAGTEFLFQQTDVAKVFMRLRGKQWISGGFANTFFELDDYLDAPIAWMSGVGGMGVNDDLYTAYSVLGDYPFKADIYGFQWRKSQCSYAFDGPPGNMLDWQSACHEVYQSTRAPALGMWGVVAACTLANFDFSLPPTASPTKYRRGIRVTNTTGGSAWIATFGGASALGSVVPGQVYSFIANIRSDVAAAARNANLRVAWFTSGGTQVGSDIVGPTVSVPNTGVFTKVAQTAVIAPATAAKVQMQIVIASANTETHDVVGCGIMKGIIEGNFGPPFVAQHTDAEAPIANGSIAGDRWYRTDATTVPGKREYIQTVGTKAVPAKPDAQLWLPIDSSDVKRLLVDQAFTSVTLAPLTFFDVAVAANEMYTIEYKLQIVSAATTTGWQFSLTGPASPTSVLGVEEYQSSATAFTSATIQAFGAFTLVTASYVATPSAIFARITLQLVNGTNAGTVQLNVATEVASSAITIKKGSLVTVM
jgi:hypothetical protein